MAKKFFAAVVIVYFAIASVVFVPYYNWQYAKTNGFVKWFFFGEIIATAEGLIWPYFVFWSTNNYSVKKPSFHVVKSLDYANMAMEIIINNQNNKKISESDMLQITDYYKKALVEAKQVDIDSLNNFYPELGTHFEGEFINGLELFIEAYEKHDAPTALAAQLFLERWSNWYDENIDRIKGR